MLSLHWITCTVYIWFFFFMWFKLIVHNFWLDSIFLCMNLVSTFVNTHLSPVAQSIISLMQFVRYFSEMYTPAREVTLSILCLPPLSFVVYSKWKEFATGGIDFFSFWKRLLNQSGSMYKEANRKSQTLASPVKITG